MVVGYSPTNHTVRLKYVIPRTVQSVRVHPNYVMNVTDSTGFNSTENGFKWDGATESPSIWFSVKDSDRAKRNGYGIVGNGSYIPVPRHSTQPNTPIGITSQYGTVAGETMYLGPTKVYKKATEHREFKLVVPKDVRMQEHPDDVLESFSNASSNITRSGSRRIPILVVPTSLDRGGDVPVERTEMRVRADEDLETARNAWTHEYVHMEQRSQMGYHLMWFTEASASYFAADLTRGQDRISTARYNSWLFYQYAISRIADRDVVLGEPSTWYDPESTETSRAPYRKGTVVLSALDAEIKQRTDGEKSLEDVFIRMSGQPGVTSYDQFKDIVAEVAGERMDDWLDMYVASKRTPVPSLLLDSLGLVFRTIYWIVGPPYLVVGAFILSRIAGRYLNDYLNDLDWWPFPWRIGRS